MTRFFSITSVALIFLFAAALTGCGGSQGASGPEVTDAVVDSGPDAVKNLVKSLTATGFPGIQMDALRRLGDLGPKAAAAIPDVEKCAAEEEDEAVRTLAAEILPKLKG